MDKKTVESIFRQLYLSELETGATRALEEYQALFPGYEEAIEAQFQRMRLAPPVEENAAQPQTASGQLDIERIGHYKLLEEIGRGGQATVYLAEDEQLGRRMALKVMPALGPRSEVSLLRFRREAEICSRLNDPGICTVFEAGIDQGMAFIAMEYVKGKTLSRLLSAAREEDSEAGSFIVDTDAERDAAEAADKSLRRTPPATPPDLKGVRRLVAIVERAARALHAAHEAGVIHRDIKPGNIIVDDEDRPVMLDFGLARDVDAENLSLTQSGEFFGTPLYMSPEQISAHRISLDRRTDIFSLAVTLYECLTARSPFDAATREGVYQAIMAKDPPDPRKFNSAISRDLRVVIQKALEKDRDQRYATAEELADDLERARTMRPVLARPAGPLVRVARWVQRNRQAAGMLGVLILVVVVAGAISLWQESKIQWLKETHKSKMTIEELEGLLENIRTNPFINIIAPNATAEAAIGVRELGAEGREIMVRYLSSPEADTRMTAANVLRHVGGSRMIEELTEVACRDSDIRVAGLASHALLSLTGEQALTSLRRVVSETEHLPAKVNALWGLCRLGDEAAVVTAREFFNDKKQDENLRYALGSGVFFLSDEELLPFADDVLSSLLDKGTERKVIANLVSLAIRFYKRVGTPAAQTRLNQIASDPQVVPDIKREAEEALRALEPSGVH
jgi:serine/threonine protein kinase